MNNYLNERITPVLGCDPEIFLRGKVRGRSTILPSEALIPPQGLHVKGLKHLSIVRDGIQAELHPGYDSCRARLSNGIATSMKMLQAKAAAKGLDIDFSGTIKLSKGNMARLSDDAKRLGCLPSLNAYGRKHLEKDGSKYPYRSGGGHIHISGLKPILIKDTYTSPSVNDLRDLYLDHIRVVKVLDILVGLPCVLIDTDINAAIRRKLYGRAGEHRLPAHGIEYRTLSNFWLKSYPVMSMVFGMVANAINAIPYIADVPADMDDRLVTYAKFYGYKVEPHVTHWYHMAYLPTPNDPLRDAAKALMKIPEAEVERAINTADKVLARALVDAYVKPFWMSHSATKGIDKNRVDAFEKIVELGIDTIWPGNPAERWATKKEGHGTGFESMSGKIAQGFIFHDYDGAVQQKHATPPPPPPATPIVGPHIEGL